MEIWGDGEIKVRQKRKAIAEREKVLARGPGSAGRGHPDAVSRWRWLAAARGSGASLGRDGATGPSVAARGRLSAAVVHASGARRCARAHLYFAAGSLQPRAGLMLAPPLRHRELVDWPLEKQAHFSPSPLVQGWEPSLQARRRVETRGLGRGKGPHGPRVLTPGSPRYPACKGTQPS